MKNQDLCERAFCRDKWTRMISGNSSNHRLWKLKLCDLHARQYEGSFRGIVASNRKAIGAK
jgi:hypothetical protein